MTLFGQDNASAGAPTSASLEIFDARRPARGARPNRSPSITFTIPGRFCFQAEMFLSRDLRSPRVDSIRLQLQLSTIHRGNLTRSRCRSAA